MTKTNIYPIKSINDGYVVIDESAVISEGDKFIVNEYNYSQYGIKTALVVGYDIIRTKEGWPQTNPIDKDRCAKIIATIGLTIEGIPSVLLPDEADAFVRQQLAMKIKQDPAYIIKNPQRYKDLYDGYKAAQKTYSEEEVIQLIWKALELDKIGKWEHHDANKVHVKVFIQSLQTKKIIAVELEYEKGEYYSYISESDGSSVTESGGFKPDKLKVTKENTITPIKVEYE